MKTFDDVTKFEFNSKFEFKIMTNLTSLDDVATDSYVSVAQLTGFDDLQNDAANARVIS